MAGLRNRNYAGFKRKRAGLGVRPFKRRRIMSRRKAGGRVSTYNSRSTRGTTWGFRARKLPRRAWNRMLWNTTLQKTHYRSADSVIDTAANTPDTGTLARSTIFQALDNGVAKFWQTTGGAVDPDGGTLPLFRNDIILRGGTLSATVGTKDTTITVGSNYRGTLMLVKAGSNFDSTGFNSTTRPSTWDPTMFPEFSKVIGRVIARRDFFLADTSETLRMNVRIPIQKIDTGAWALGLDRYYWVLICNAPMADGTASAGVLASINVGWNVSFSADAIGTT